MYDLITFYTFAALILFFISAEIYRAKHYIKAVIIDIYSSPLGIQNALSTQMKVRLANGREVDAEAFMCTVCLGDFCVGDEVYLSRIKSKYQINLPFRLKRKTSACKNVLPPRFKDTKE